MKFDVKDLAFFWLIFRLTACFFGIIIYKYSCPVRIDPWLIWATALFLILEPLFLLLVAILFEKKYDTAKDKTKS